MIYYSLKGYFGEKANVSCENKMSRKYFQTHSYIVWVCEYTSMTKHTYTHMLETGLSWPNSCFVVVISNIMKMLLKGFHPLLLATYRMWHSSLLPHTI